MSVNKVILVGNLGKDPDLRYTPSGDAVVTFSLATTERYKDRDGNKQSKTEWHNMVAWRQLAEICGKYLHKGKQIYIEGKIQNRSYDDRDGNKRYISEVVINEMQMLGSRDDNQSGGGSGYAGGQNQSQGGQSYNQGGQNQNQNIQNSNSSQQQGGGFEEPVFNPDDEIPF
ncbi:MAG: single-stranded DNA-binding protein [Thermodesulfobacteriota bacterium]|nr:single-stranded DNA-binding protein [Thermodesulfobacteriota bacterium]